MDVQAVMSCHDATNSRRCWWALNQLRVSLFDRYSMGVQGIPPSWIYGNDIGALTISVRRLNIDSHPCRQCHERRRVGAFLNIRIGCARWIEKNPTRGARASTAFGKNHKGRVVCHSRAEDFCDSPSGHQSIGLGGNRESENQRSNEQTMCVPCDSYSHDSLLFSVSGSEQLRMLVIRDRLDGCPSRQSPRIVSCHVQSSHLMRLRRIQCGSSHSLGWSRQRPRCLAPWPSSRPRHKSCSCYQTHLGNPN